MRAALHAEWTKLRTLASPLWLLLGTVAATVALSAVAASAARGTAAGRGGDPTGISLVGDPTGISLVGVDLGQAPVAVLAVLAVGNEYGTGMIRTSLTAMPRRVTALAAKCAVLSAVVAAAGTAAVLGALLTGRIALSGPGGPALSLSDGPTLRAAVGSVLYLVLIGLLGLGVGTAVRDSATGVGLVLGLLYVFPIVAATIGDQRVRDLLEKAAPMSAGLAFQATAAPGGRPLGPWAGLGVTAGWATAALLAGIVLLGGRDG